MEIFNNHKRLFITFTVMFLILTLGVAIGPALNNQNNNEPLPNSKPLTKEETAGKLVYISNGCVGCHSQQVRNVEIDKVWGSRPGIAADYARIERTSFLQNTATLMGTERTGPDLTNIGQRQSSDAWHYLHLYNPRIVIPQSIMPRYKWLFEVKDYPEEGDIKVEVPDEYKDFPKNKVLVVTKDGMDLVAYLKSLKQVKLPDGTPDPIFLYKQKQIASNESSNGSTEAPSQTGPDGAQLYAANCQACHQSNGEGLKGAFPPLKGSKIVLDDNPEIMVGIIMKGYDAREEYGVMPAVGTNANLTAEQVAAIMNHEKSSWGNNARKVTADEVKKIMDSLK
ncbi:MAG: cytochrome c [Sphingobacteriales bacterium]|nr:cytochrome c [Sphingobacteriales bacterium]